VDAADDGDIIKLTAGVYTGTNNYGGLAQMVYISKTITLHGGYTITNWTMSDPVANATTLDAQGQGRVVHLRGSDDVTPTLEGLQLTNGSVNDLGGGIYAYQAHPIISGCHVYSNTATNGGGVFLWRSNDAILTGNIIYNNMVSGNGGGVFFWESRNARMTNNLVVDNWIGALGVGAGVDLYGSTVHLLHTTLARNRGGSGHGIYMVSGSAITATNTILVSHTVGINVGGGPMPSTATLSATLWGIESWANETDWIVGGTLNTGTTNTWGDPAFVGPEAGNYHIGPASAAINAGVDAGIDIDIDGDPRPIGAGFDIGADEYSPVAVIYLPVTLKTYSL